MTERSVRKIDFPQARCLAGAARRDITPPVGIYHRMWGAATHDRATGVHRPLLATALVLQAVGDSHGNGNQQRQVVVAIDHCLLWDAEMRWLLDRVCTATGVTEDELQIAFSHTHAAGLMDRSRAELPGGELIAPYLDHLAVMIVEAVNAAIAGAWPATVVYGSGCCNLAAHRDLVDEETGQIVCGFNPAGPADDTIALARIDADSGDPIAIVVNYACHPTTLAWDNTLISPDYVGAMRDVIEQVNGGLCVFLQGASGDLGPRHGYVGDVSVADRNGRQLGHAVVSILESLPPAGVQFAYAGPVVSGATIGTWRFEPLKTHDQQCAADWNCRRWTVDTSYRRDLPDRNATDASLASWTEEERAATAAGRTDVARDCRAQVERMNRQLVRLAQLPPGDHFPLPITCLRLGDGYWVMLEGEYYQELQRALRTRFAGTPIVVSTVVNGWRSAYLPTRETYGRGIYQEIVAVFEPGCLETVIESIGAEIESMQKGGQA